MTAGTFALTVVGAALVVGFVPAWVAHLRRTLFTSDLALVAVPALLLYGSGAYFNPSLHVGFGLIVYPFLTLVASVALLYVRVFLLDRWHPHPRGNSLACLIAASVLSVVVGAMIPPLCE